jgi:hypothetical protein
MFSTPMISHGPIKPPNNNDNNNSNNGITRPRWIWPRARAHGCGVDHPAQAAVRTYTHTCIHCEIVT